MSDEMKENSSLFLVGGGCSIPNAVRTEYTDKRLVIDGMLLNLDGSRFVKDHLENADLTVPMTTTKHGSAFFVPQNDDDLLLLDDEPSSASQRDHLKRKRTESDGDSVLALPPPPPTTAQPLSLASSPSTSSTTTAEATNEVAPLLRHYAHVCGVNMNETILENAELCGSNLAVKLMQMGADSILEEIQQSVIVIPTP
jgi:Porphobilinogen deaminase, C-terminal domain